MPVQETRIASFAYDDASAQRLFEKLGDAASSQWKSAGRTYRTTISTAVVPSLDGR